MAGENRGEPLGVEASLRLIDLEENGDIALAALEELHKTTRSGRVLFAIARYRYAVGAYENAARDFRGAVGGLEGEKQEEARVWEGIALHAAGRLDEGIALLEKRARSSNGSVAHLARLVAGEIRLAEGDARRCKSLVGPLLSQETIYRRPVILLAARAYRALGERDQAESLFRELVSQDPETAEASAAREHLINLQSTGQAEDGWYIQIASFTSEENARRFLAAKQREGIGALRMFRVTRDGETVHPIRIGPFDNEEEARGAKDRLAGQGIEGHVVDVPAIDGTAATRSDQ